MTKKIARNCLHPTKRSVNSPQRASAVTRKCSCLIRQVYHHWAGSICSVVFELHCEDPAVRISHAKILLWCPNAMVLTLEVRSGHVGKFGAIIRINLLKYAALCLLCLLSCEHNACISCAEAWQLRVFGRGTNRTRILSSYSHDSSQGIQGMRTDAWRLYLYTGRIGMPSTSPWECRMPWSTQIKLKERVLICLVPSFMRTVNGLKLQERYGLRAEWRPVRHGSH